MHSLKYVPVVLWMVLVLAGCTTGGAGDAAGATCRGSEPVDWSSTMRSGDADLYLLVRGRHCDAPAILWLHGGPGAAETPLFRLYDSALEDSFVVAYWDQRGAGRSYDPDADPARLTVAQHLQDLDAVVDAVRAHLGKKKVVLVGHSWGSALGLLYARDHGEKLAAFVGVAQFVSGLAGQRAQYAFVDARARAEDDQDAEAALADIGRPPYSAKQELRVQSLVDDFGGYFHTRPSFLLAVFEAVVYGYVAPWDIPTFIHANDVSLDAMNDELLSLDLRRSVPSVRVPVVFMLGRYDRQLDARIAADYFEKLKARRKSLIWFERSAHNIPFEQPDAFVTRLRTTLVSLGIRPSH